MNEDQFIEFAARERTGRNKAEGKEMPTETTDRLLDAVEASIDAYRVAIEEGVSSETARNVLPEATATIISMNGTVRSWLHFLEKRLAYDAQLEIRAIAREINNTLFDHIPITMSTWSKMHEYREAAHRKFIAEWRV